MFEQAAGDRPATAAQAEAKHAKVQHISSGDPNVHFDALSKHMEASENRFEVLEQAGFRIATEGSRDSLMS